MYRFIAALLAAALLAATFAAAAGRWPWRRRIGTDVVTLHLTAHRNTPVELWPPEPATPAAVDRTRFGAALGELCGKLPDERRDAFAGAILAESARFAVDPFLLAGLLYDQSRCWPLTPRRDAKLGRLGMTRVPLALHAAQIRDGAYTYYVRAGEDWQPRTLDVGRHPFVRREVLQLEPNLYFAAAFLKVFDAQCADLDAAFPGAPHRHPVAHWFYGDRVAQVEPENRVLTARRRLLAYYDGRGPVDAGRFAGNALVSPLDGTPRLAIDYFGNPRGKRGTAGHRGIDIDGTTGEPVRAIADGRVTFAGVDKPGTGEHEFLSPKEARTLTPDQMGPGGLYVTINHAGDFGTIYMHLDSLAVSYGDEVRAGQVIGTLGRSGTKTPGPHLHLEFRVGTSRVDPAAPLAAVLVDPHADR